MNEKLNSTELLSGLPPMDIILKGDDPKINLNNL